MRVCQFGVTVEIDVKLTGSRKKPTGISGRGDTVEAAVVHLVDGLDIWAQVLK